MPSHPIPSHPMPYRSFNQHPLPPSPPTILVYKLYRIPAHPSLPQNCAPSGDDATDHGRCDGTTEPFLILSSYCALPLSLLQSRRLAVGLDLVLALEVLYFVLYEVPYGAILPLSPIPLTQYSYFVLLLSHYRSSLPCSIDRPWYILHTPRTYLSLLIHPNCSSSHNLSLLSLTNTTTNPSVPHKPLDRKSVV